MFRLPCQICFWICFRFSVILGVYLIIKFEFDVGVCLERFSLFEFYFGIQQVCVGFVFVFASVSNSTPAAPNSGSVRFRICCRIAHSFLGSASDFVSVVRTFGCGAGLGFGLGVSVTFSFGFGFDFVFC